jgi:hypothetical protein
MEQVRLLLVSLVLLPASLPRGRYSICLSTSSELWNFRVCAIAELREEKTFTSIGRGHGILLLGSRICREVNVLRVRQGQRSWRSHYPPVSLISWLL